MAYTVQTVSSASDLALAIAAIPDYMELVEVAEVGNEFWLITEPDDDDVMPMCCCDCHNVAQAATEDTSMYMAHTIDTEGFTKNVNEALDRIGDVLKKVRTL